MGHGRPSLYTSALGDAICEHIAGGKSLSSYCAQDGAPGYETVMRWLREDRKERPEDEGEEGFRVKYTRAREDQADRHADHILDLSERMERARKDKLVDEVAPLVAAAHERKWLAGKMKPKVYGDAQRVEHSGDGGGALRIIFERPPPEGDGG